MSELDALGKELRDELGAPPPGWEEQQRRRLLRHDLRARPMARRRFVATLALACALAGVGYVGFFRRDTAVEDASEWLDASSSPVPYVAADGSHIELDVGTRGRFSTDGHASQFDLHGGRAAFEVAKRPNQDWTVVAGKYTLRVIGTRFSVRYKEVDLDVWVQEGRVAVLVPQRAEPLVLEAGDYFAARGEEIKLETQRSGDDVSLSDGATARPAREEADLDLQSRPGSSLNDGPLNGEQAHDGNSSAKTNLTTDSQTDWHALYVEGKYRDALREAKRIGFDDLTRRSNASRLLDLSDAARLGGDSWLALAALRALESRFPGPALSMDSDFLMGRLHAQRGEADEATRRLTRYVERGDGSRYTVEALGRLVELYSKSGNEDQARAFARRYLDRAPNGPYHRSAESVLGQK
jgi:TolA-binding protein